MRVFAVEQAPLRILAEGVDDSPALTWDEEDCLTEEQLLLTAEGRRALDAWRRGDDSVYEVSELANLALSQAEDELFEAGLEARPDLRERLRERPPGAQLERLLIEIQRAGAEPSETADQG